MRWRSGLILALLTITLCGSYWPSAWQPWLDEIYGQQLYPALQAQLARLPSPTNGALSDLLWLLLAGLLLVRILWLVKRVKQHKIALICLDIALWLSLGTATLMLTWGLNYQRTTLYEQLQQQGFVAEMSAERWLFALQQTQRTLSMLPPDFDYCASDNPQFSAQRSAAFAHSAMALAGYRPAPIREVKASAWSWLYTRLAVAGLYVPFTGEPTYNDEIFPLTKPFVMTHEFAHWGGWALEYDADILAYWSLWLAPDPRWQYSAWLGWWSDSAAPANVREQWPTELRFSLRCQNQYNQQRPRWRSRKLLWQLYEKALQTQGVAEGLQSYQMGEAMALISYQDWLYPAALN